MAVIQLADAVTKNNVQMDLVKVVVSGSKVFAGGPLA